jgi:hypothetical protein
MKMTKKKAVEFYSVLTGHPKAFVERNLSESKATVTEVFRFTSGLQMYQAWINKGRIYCQHFLENSCQSAWYFDFDTYEIDWKSIERDEAEDLEYALKERM